VIVSTYYVYKDEKAINSTSNWWIGVLLIWILILPAYILLRKSIFEKNKLSISKADSFENKDSSNGQQEMERKVLSEKFQDFDQGPYISQVSLKK